MEMTATAESDLFAFCGAVILDSESAHLGGCLHPVKNEMTQIGL